ncbi:MAG TPA: hypothetical protein DDZ89_11635 [Clostridiales bacterium]|nr:hypothetical protein [Clostridiales bacterium]
MTTIGYQASSLKDYLTTASDVLSTFAKLKDIGYRHLQLQWIHPDVPFESVKEALQETGLTCIATQDSFSNVKNNLDLYITMNKVWNSPSLCVSTIPESQMNPEGIQAFCTDMVHMSKVLENHGIQLTYHPVSFNFAKVRGVSAVDLVMEMLPEDIGLVFCIYHAVKAEIDPVGLLERYKGRIQICHIKDSAVFSDDKEYLVPAGQGQIRWPLIFEACRRTGVQWGLAEQESFRKDAFVCARESFEYIISKGIKSPLSED